jgi:hypothetical protein
MRLFFVRVGSFGGFLENLMFVDVTFVDGAIEDACTKWVNETQFGRDAWEESSEDFNIGDMAIGMCPSLRSYLFEEGIAEIEFEQAERNQLNYYDQKLVGHVREQIDG